MASGPPTIQSITNKIQTISLNLGANNGFIADVKNALSGIRQRLNTVLETRANFQNALNDNKKMIDNLNAQLGKTANTIRDLEQQKKTAEATLQDQLGKMRGLNQRLNDQDHAIAGFKENQQRITNELNVANSALSASKQQLAALNQQRGALQNEIAVLDGQINQIATVVDTQKRLLDPNNATYDQNLFNHIGGLNAILDSILNLQAPPPPPGGAGAGFGPGAGGPGAGFGQRRLVPDSPTLQPGRFSPGGAGGNFLQNNGSNFGSDSDSESDLSLGGPPGLGSNMPGPNFSNGNPYQQPRGGRKTRRKRLNKKSKKGGRKSMHKRTRSKK